MQLTDLKTVYENLTDDEKQLFVREYRSFRDSLLSKPLASKTRGSSSPKGKSLTLTPEEQALLKTLGITKKALLSMKG